MCSIGEEDFGDDGGAHTMPSEPKFGNAAVAAATTTSTIQSNEICRKCNQNTVSVKLNLKDAQCESCFYQYVRHKMRAEMGSTKIIQRGANVILVFDGTIEACVMFDMVRHAIALEQFKRLTIRPYAIYVDNSCIMDLTIEQRQQIISDTFTILKTFDFESYYASIAADVPIKKFNRQQLQSTITIDNEQLSIEADFLQKYNAIRNQTAKEDYRIRLNLNRYRDIAAKIQCMYVFLPTISHQIANDLLVNVALGRGKSVANDISFCDNRSNWQAKIVRPMRTVTLLEIETYVRLDASLKKLIENNRQLISTNAPAQPTMPPTSIQSLTKQFIDNLQENYASTVSTVYRTGDKISAAAAAAAAAIVTHKHQRIQHNINLNNDDDDDDDLVKLKKSTCKFCHSELDFEHSNTLLAIEYSRCVSTCADRNKVNDVDIMMNLAENQVLGNAAANDGDDTNSLMKSLCHACRNIFRDLNEPLSYI